MTTPSSDASPPHAGPPDTGSADVLHDAARLREIAALDLASPAVDAELQALVAAAAAHFRLPTALVSIVLDEAQHFAAEHGLDGWFKEVGGTPMELSFCQFAVRTRAPVVIESAAEDPRTAGNEVVHVDGVRCYAGVPLISARGHALGSFCVIGKEARTFSPQDVADLGGFAARALAHIEARRAG